MGVAPATGTLDAEQIADRGVQHGSSSGDRYSHHHLPVPTAFASAQELDAAALQAAPVRLPRPSALAAPLKPGHRRRRTPPRRSGCTRSATCSSTCRATAARRGRSRRWRPGEQATVVVEVRSITSRPVRRRGMRPLVEATVADGTGVMKVDVLQPALARGQVPAGHAAGAARQLRGPQPLPRHARTRRPSEADAAPRARRRRALPGDRGPVLHADPRARAPPPRRRSPTSSEPLPGRLRAAERLPDRPAALDRGALRRPRGRPAPAGLRGAAARPARPAAPPRAPPRGARGAGRSTARAELTRALAGGRSCRSRLTGDQRAAIDAARRRPRRARGRCSACSWARSARARPSSRCYALLRAVEHGRQAALMAPTETLAEQHFATLQALMPGEAVPAALLTGSTPAARRADLLGQAGQRRAVARRRHARADRGRRSPSTASPSPSSTSSTASACASARRWTARRAAGLAPHVLHMTATPIPRTLALLGYGDLDVTALRELPRGRRPITTHVASGERERARAYERIREELRAGRQAFVVCPLVEESEALQARAATAEFERLRRDGAPRLPRRPAARPDAPAREGRRRWRASRPAGPTCSSRRRSSRSASTSPTRR